MYTACFVPECTVPFRRCQIHHIDPFGRDGPTNLGLLYPVCNRHHHALHEGGWKVALAPGRIATITLPDGTTLTSRPDHWRGAA